ncbi:MAG: hypothetical protein AAF799_37285 [Myxococcota bacterium]
MASPAAEVGAVKIGPLKLGVPSLARVRHHDDPSSPAYVGRDSHRRAVIDLIARHMSPLQAKVRRRVLDELSRRIVDREGEIDLFFQLDESERLAATLLHARHVIPVLEAEEERFVVEFRRLVRAHDALDSQAEQRRFLADHLQRTASSRGQARADRAALRRNLNLEALKERHDGDRHRVLVQVEVSLDFMAGALVTLGPDAPAPTESKASALALLGDSDVLEFLVTYARTQARWQTRWAAARALEAYVCTGITLTDAQIEGLRGRIADKNEHPWVVSVLVSTLWTTRPQLARTITEERLRTPLEHPLDFLVRRLLLDQTHRDGPWALGVIEALLHRGDPAQHVRLGINRVLRRLLDEHPEALDLIVSQVGILPASAPEPEPAPRRKRKKAKAEPAPAPKLELPSETVSTEDVASSNDANYDSADRKKKQRRKRRRKKKDNKEKKKRKKTEKPAPPQQPAQDEPTEAVEEPAKDEPTPAEPEAPTEDSGPSEHAVVPDVGDAAARVRAVAGRALVVTLGERLACPEAGPRGKQSLAYLHTWLRRERDELPLLVTFEALRRVLEDIHEDHDGREALRILAPVLAELSRDGAASPAIHEDAAATLETLDRVLSPPRRALVARLRSALSQTSVPGSCRVPLTEDNERADVGRALAEITRDDWGVSASLSPRRARLRRGDRFTTKLWRVLHEIRNPAPNKRQGFRHTVGRVLTGDLRAHSGQLHEVTPTVVPGERVHIRGEGGWGRHVPSADDVTTVPLLRPRPVELYSSFGVTRLRATGSLAKRLWSRARLTFRYAEVAAQRSTSLDSDEPEESRRYLTMLRDRYGIEVEIEPAPPCGEHPRALPERITALLPGEPEPPADASSKPSTKVAALALAPDALTPGVLPRLDEWLDTHVHYFLSMQANQQASLAAFFLGAFALFFGDSFRRRHSIDRARKKIPLCIGGWGTRGKSGTERIKAGLFHGLGYQVFSKTTGCEAMMIHSVPEGPPAEVFVFRPYGKATIWEQRNLLELGAALEADVFLWECMALNPKYVEIIQHKWMRDDLSTLTNAYPDHEDIQGPAGMDVANTISRFIPDDGIILTSEINFLPLFREVCRERDSELVAIGPHEGDLIAPELLDLFPYQEHPRNIALVAQMAEQLDVDHDLAIVTMAQHVVADLGVLKSYPPVRVCGRVLKFINGCSANERAGFLGNWERTGCAALAESEDPEQLVITVVNNRDDRISRSEVFGRILVNDCVVDRHVLIGTNLRGLLSYLRGSMAIFLQNIQLVRAADLEDPEGRERALGRLAALMQRLRISPLSANALLARLRTYAAGCGLELRDPEPARKVLEQALASDGGLELAKLRKDFEQDAKLRAALDAGLSEPTEASTQTPPEVLIPCERKELEVHFARQLARAVIHARLRRQLEALFDNKSTSELGAYEDRVRETYRVMFDDMLVVVEDPKTKGDAIVQACARCVPPGTHVRIMGTQNIKGTGLDFVYRWLAVDAVVAELKILQGPEDDGRLGALERLQAFADHGVMDLGLLHRYLRENEPRGAAERAPFDRLKSKVEPAYKKKRAPFEAATGPDAPGGKKKKTWVESAASWIEGWLDFLDGARRFHGSAAIMKDLVHGRVSHPRAAVLMREIYAREKGGWLLARFSNKG